MKPRYRNFAELLQGRAEQEPEKNAFILLNHHGDSIFHLNFFNLDQRARAIAGYLAQACSSPPRVLLIFSQTDAFITAFSGTLYSGVAGVPIRLPKARQSMKRFQAVIKDADADVVLTDRVSADYIQQHAGIYQILMSKRLVVIQDISKDYQDGWRRSGIKEEKTAYLQYTSGTTGAPKGVMLTHDNMLNQCETVETAFHLSRRTRALSWMPYDYHMGLVFGILQPIYSGFTGYLSLLDEVIEQPIAWLQAISRYRIACSGGPNFAYAHCTKKITPEQKACLDLSCWKNAWIGGEPILKSTLHNFIHAFESCGLTPSALVPCYHLTEAALPLAGTAHQRNPICKAIDPKTLAFGRTPPAGPGCSKKVELVGCGRPMNGHQVVIVHPLTRKICKDSAPGEIWIRGSGNASAYWRRPLQSKTGLHASLEGEADGSWLRTGDWGMISKGQLYVGGRLRNGESPDRSTEGETPVVQQRGQGQIAKDPPSNGEPAAVIGMAGIFPQSDDCEQFWQNIAAGKHLITEIPHDRWNWREIYGTSDNTAARTPIKWGGFINDLASFDAEFFNISPKEARYMDPIQRKMLQVVWQAIENAGYRISDLSGRKVGVFIGLGTFDYLQLVMENQAFVHAYTSTGMLHCMVPNRISYLFNFQGPSEAVDTACSSSLVALHRALGALRTGECELAIVGGANAIIHPSIYVALANANMLSEDGKCKTFDATADGYVRGEGVAAILLKPLSRARADKDYLYALIRGTAVNHSGHTNSLTAPNPFAQADVISKALGQAGIHPGTVSYVETHGTGTSLGDPIEINGLKMAFHTSAAKASRPNPPSAYCALGTVKTNIGHLEAAAGIAGVVKVIMAMKHRQIPAHLHFTTVNPKIDLKGSPFYLVGETTRPWEAMHDDQGKTLPRRAGVSSFGFGGVNAHAVIEEYTADAAPCKLEPVKMRRLFVLSARSETQLLNYGRQMASFIKDRERELHLDPLTYTLQIGREPMDVRLAILANDLSDLREKLDGFISNQALAVQVYSGTLFYDRITPGLARHVFDADDPCGQQLLEQLLCEKDTVHLAQLWVLGVEVRWTRLYREASSVGRIPLPAYPFKKEKHWITLRQADRQIDASRAEDIFDIEWVAAAKASSETKEGLARAVQFILLCDRKGIGQAFAELLEKKGFRYSKVFYNTASKVQGDKAYTIDPFEKKSYQKVMGSIRSRSNGRPHYILNFWPLDHVANDDFCLKDISDATHFTCATALNLIQAITSDPSGTKDLVWFICSNVQPVSPTGLPNLKAAALWGLAKTMLLEHHDIFRAIVDIDGSDPGDTAATLLDEISGYDDEGEIVFRKRKRYVARLRASSVQSQSPLQVKKDGAYLITGGLGTLGLLTARWLSGHKAGRVLLLGRKGLDPSRTDPLSRTKQTLLAAIQANGTKVDILLADVANREAMANACGPYLETGEIRGIFHAAGAISRNLIKDMTRADFERVIAAKVQGTLVLHELTQGLPLDYFVMYSSAASIWGAATGAHYSAANCFLDLYTHYRAALNLPATSVNWGGMWKGSGIISSEDEKYMRSIGIKDTLPDDGLRLLESILESGARQKVVAPVDWEKFLQVMQVKRKHRLFDYIQQTVTSKQGALTSGESFMARLSGLSETEKTDQTMAKLTELLKNILGLENESTVPANKGFFDLGLDSLTSIDFKNKIKTGLGIDVSTTTLFDFNNLQLLAGHIAGTYFSDDPQDMKTGPAKAKDGSGPEEAVLDQVNEVSLIEVLKLENDLAASA